MSRLFSFYLLLLTIRPILAISPTFLWSVANSSLTEKRAPKYCPKVVLTNNTTLANETVGGDFEGLVPNSYLFVERFLEGDWAGWDEAEDRLRLAQNLTIENRLEPCIVILSLVLHSAQYDGLLGLQPTLRHRLSDLFQYSTPIRTRHLVLMRVSEEFSFCTKGTKYPSRLVPAWEMILFDFFSEARVIQGLFHDSDEPYLKVTKETGKWKWFCEDTIERLEYEKACRANATCLAQHPGIGEWRAGFRPNPNCTLGYRPRQIMDWDRYPPFTGFVPGNSPGLPYPYSKTPDAFTWIEDPFYRRLVTVYLGIPIILLFLMCLIGVISVGFYTVWKTFYMVTLLPRKERRIRYLRKVRKKKHEDARQEENYSESSSTDDPDLQYPSQSRLQKTNRETVRHRKRRKDREKRRIRKKGAVDGSFSSKQSTVPANTGAPSGMAASTGVPSGMAASTGAPSGIAASTGVPSGMAASTGVPSGMAASTGVPSGMAASTGVPSGMAASTAASKTPSQQSTGDPRAESKVPTAVPKKSTLNPTNTKSLKPTTVPTSKATVTATPRKPKSKSTMRAWIATRRPSTSGSVEVTSAMMRMEEAEDDRRMNTLKRKFTEMKRDIERRKVIPIVLPPDERRVHRALKPRPLSSSEDSSSGGSRVSVPEDIKLIFRIREERRRELIETNEVVSKEEENPKIIVPSRAARSRLIQAVRPVTPSNKSSKTESARGQMKGQAAGDLESRASQKGESPGPSRTSKVTIVTPSQSQGQGSQTSKGTLTKGPETRRETVITLSTASQSRKDRDTVITIEEPSPRKNTRPIVSRTREVTSTDPDFDLELVLPEKYKDLRSKGPGPYQQAQAAFAAARAPPPEPEEVELSPYLMRKRERERAKITRPAPVHVDYVKLNKDVKGTSVDRRHKKPIMKPPEEPGPSKE